jgi:phosphonate transport system substrate-binding protein
MSPHAWLGVLLAAALVAGGGAAEAPTPAGASTPPSRPLRLGFSRRALDAEVNINDGLAAIRLHADIISRADNLPIDINRTLFESIEAIREALRQEEVDVLALLTDEYVSLPPNLFTGLLLAAVLEGRTEDEYVLITHRKHEVNRLADLRGRDVVVYHNARSALSQAWLDVLTLKAELGAAAQAFRTLTVVGKPSQAVLPVFFGRQHAAVVTAQSLRIIQELNPQVGREIRILETSRPYLPSVLCFRAGGPPADYDRLARTVMTMHTSTSGRQVTTIFKSEKFVLVSPETLQPARELLAERQALMAKVRASGATAAPEGGRPQP